MPRLTFSTAENFVAWLKSRDLDRYEFYRTASNDMIAVPLKSTQPQMYGKVYLSETAEEKIVTDFLAKHRKFINDVLYFEWDSTKTPGAEKAEH